MTSRDAAIATSTVARRLCGDTLGLVPGMGDDRLRVGRGLALLLPVIGEQLLGFVAQLAGFLEFAADTRRALVEAADDRAARRLPHHDGEDHHREEDPKLRIGEQVHQCLCLPRLPSTAAAIRAISGVTPVSFSTTARPTSTAMPRTSASASSLVAAMRRSAAAICSAKAAASARWRSAPSAASRSAVSLIVAWACARASDRVFW